MNAGKLVLASMLSLLVGSAGYATTINYGAEFAAPPATGWSYLYNPGNSYAIGDSAHYQALSWDSSVQVYCGGGAWPGSVETNYLGLQSTNVYPGPATVQGATRDCFAIAAYEVQDDEGGLGSIINSSLYAGGSATATGLEVRVYVNDDLKSDTIVPYAGSVNSNFNCSLGTLVAHDKVYVCVGPNGDQNGDNGNNFGYSIQITSVPEPATDVLMLGSAIGGLLAYAWRKRR